LEASREIIRNQVYSALTAEKSTEAISELNKPAEMEKNVKLKFEEKNRKSESGNPLKTIFRKRPEKIQEQNPNKLEFFEAETLD